MGRGKESDYLHIGDPVWWRGNWGEALPKMAEIGDIETNCDAFTHNGTPRERLIWEKVRSPETVVSLTNGHWAEGHQIWQVEIRKT